MGANNWGYSAALALVSLLLWGIMIAKYRKTYFGTFQVSHNYKFILCILVLYSTFAFAEADTYHYKSILTDMLAYQEHLHIESFYFWLGQVLNDYYLWRFVIWGTAAFLIVLSCKLLNLDSNIIGFLLPILFFRQFSLTRGALGFALLIFSLVLLMNSKKYYIQIIGITGIICTTFFHRSLPLFLAFIPVAYFFPLSKKWFVISLLLFPILYKIVGLLLPQILSFDWLPEETVDASISYIEDARKDVNWKGYLGQLIQFIGIGLMLYLSIKYYIKHRNITNRTCKFFIKYTYILIYLSFLLYEQNTSSYLSPRALHAATFPMLISVAYYYQHTQRSALDKTTLWLLTLHSLYNILYFIYKYQ